MDPGPRSVEGAGRRRSAVVPLALGLACLVVLLGPVLLSGTMPYGFDTIHEAYPEFRWAYGEIRQGRLPAWNPYVFAGYPLMADPTAIGILYPPNLIHLLMPTRLAITFSLIAHLFLSACLMYQLQRRLGACREGATLGALTWVLGGFVAGHIFLGELPHLAVVAWAPGLLLCVESLLAGGSGWRIVPVGGAVVAASLLAGHIQYGGMGIAAAAVLVLGRVAGASRSTERWRLTWRGLGGLAAMCTLGALLSAPLCFPALALITQSTRGGALDWASVAGVSLPPWQLLSLLAPGFFGDIVESRYWGGFPMELVTPYLGVLPLVLVPFGLRQQGARRALPWLVLLAGGLLLGMGRYTPVYRLLFEVVPLFDRLRMPARWLELFVLGASVLAGAGATRLLTGRERAAGGKGAGTGAEAHAGEEDRSELRSGGRPWRSPELIVMSLALLLLFVSFVPPIREWRTGLLHLAWRSGGVWLAERMPLDASFESLAAAASGLSLLSAAAGLFAAGAALRLVRTRAGRTPALRWVLPILAGADLLLWSHRFVIPYDESNLSWKPSLLAALRSEPQPYRVATHVPQEATPHPSGVLLSYPGMNTFSQSFQHQGMVEGIANVAGVFGAAPDRYVRLTIGAHSFEHVFPDRRAVLEMLNVRLLLADRSLPRKGEVWEGLDPIFEDGEVVLYRDPRALDRAFLVPRVEVVETIEDALSVIRAPGFDPRAAAVIERSDLPPAITLPAATRELAPDERATISTYEPRVIDVATHTRTPRFLVLSDLFEDEWKAWVDSRPVPLSRVNVALRGVAVPAGDHAVRFLFFPRRFAIGCAIGATTLMAMLAVWVVKGRTHPAATPGLPPSRRPTGSRAGPPEGQPHRTADPARGRERDSGAA